MPIIKCPKGKYRIGHGKCQYKSKNKAKRAYSAYLAKKNREGQDSIEEAIKELVLGKNIKKIVNGLIRDETN